jgi:hypothetical protein
MRSSKTSARSRSAPQPEHSEPVSSGKSVIRGIKTDEPADAGSQENTEAWTNPFSGSPSSLKKSAGLKGNKRPARARNQKQTHDGSSFPRDRDAPTVPSPTNQIDEPDGANRILKINTDLFPPLFYYRVAFFEAINLANRKIFCQLAGSMFGGNWIISHSITETPPSNGAGLNVFLEGDSFSNAIAATSLTIQTSIDADESVPDSGFLLVSDISVLDEDLAGFTSLLATFSDATSIFKAPFGHVKSITRQENTVTDPWDIATLATFGIVGGLLEIITGRLIPPVCGNAVPNRHALVLDHAFMPVVTRGQPAILVHVEKDALGMQNLSSMLGCKYLEPQELVGCQVKDTTSTFQGVVTAIIGTLGGNQNRQRLIQLTQKPSTKLALESAPGNDLILGVASGEHVYEYITSMLQLVQTQSPSTPAPIGQSEGTTKIDEIIVDFVDLCNNPARLIDQIVSLIRERYPDLLVTC